VSQGLGLGCQGLDFGLGLGNKGLDNITGDRVITT